MLELLSAIIEQLKKNFTKMPLVLISRVMLPGAFISIILSAQVNEYGGEGFLIQNFSSSDQEIHPQNWYVIQTPKDIICFANHTAVLEYDGTYWKKIPVTNTFVRSLSSDKNGNIFIGGRGQIGLIINDSLYNEKYFSLNEYLNESEKNYTNVYKTYTTNDGVFFGSIEYLFRFGDNKIKTWEPVDKFSLAFNVDDKIFIREVGIGLKQVVNDKLELIPDGEIFSNLGIRDMLEFDDNRVLILSGDKGFFIYDGNKIKPYPTLIDDFINKNRVYHGINLSDGNIAFATQQNGVIVINPEGKLLNNFNKKNGLQDNNVKYILQDRQDNLWLGLNNGISKIEYSSPFSVFDKRMGLDGIVLSIAKFQDNLYAGTTSGLYKLNTVNTKDSNFELKNFEKNGLINSNIWVLLPINDELLIGTSGGIYLINSEDKQKKISSSRVYTMHRSDETGGPVFIGTNGGLNVLYKDGTKWLEYNLYSQMNSRITTVSVSSGRDIWIGTLSGGVFRIDKSAGIRENIFNRRNVQTDESFIEQYDTSYGLPPGEINIFNVSNRILFATGIGIYKFDEQKEKFIPDSLFGTMFADGSRGVFQIIEDEKKNVWIHSNSENFLAEHQDDGSYKIISKPFRRLELSQVNAICPDGDVTWFGRTNSEIIKYDTKKKKRFITDFNALIRKVLINGDSLIYGGGLLPDDFEPLSLPYENRNLRFQYACPFYEGKERTEFQYKLEGYDEQWSPWKKETQKDYTNLSEGNYIFNVRAKNIYGDMSKTAAYSFKVLPPFYRTVWAYLLYAILILTLGFLIVKWRINILEKEKKHLSQLVDEKAGEIKKQNIRLSEQAEKLKELDKIKSRFFANISHEFRTPLTLILGPTEQMLKEEKSAEKKKSHSLILRNSKKLLNLINQLLDISKLESGKMQLRVSKINLIHFIREITFMFESLADKRKINLGFYFENEKLEVYCDTDKIEKVIINLLSNAFKFTGENGDVTVFISEEGKSENYPDGYAKIMVMDTGIGISGENLEHVFDPFYQADASTKRKYEGTGIGLSLVKEFVELHKGSVTVESSEGEGTKFIIKLPLGNTHFCPDQITGDGYNEKIIEHFYSAADPEEEFSVNGSTEEIPDPDQSEKILVVDDNKDVRSYIKEHLEKDYNVIEAADGEEGFAKAKEVSPDLIVSDVMMPKMDGFEFCENIKKDVNTSHIPVILLTAKAGDENIIQGLETGADDYITKPFNVEILSIRIKNLIELGRQIQQKYQKQLFLQPAEIRVTSVDETFLKTLHELVEENLSDPEFNIENLTDKFNMSYTSLFRKIKALTGEAPVKFLRSYRLKRAAQLIKAKSGNITEIAFSVGFNNSAYFTKCFKEQFNRLPSEFHSVEG
ncbi:MAG: ATP-binding protein [Ignavibacteria bacterium]|jgi:signal transduction histidine kinase/DNA-binding response OmpR family regulator/ligand-binding sensor domain-containing protein